MPWYYAVAERDHDLQNPTSPEKIRHVGELLRLGPDSRVLDVACGMGGPAMLLATADVLARLEPPGALLPDVLDRSVHLAVAHVVESVAERLGLTRTTEFLDACHRVNGLGR